MHREVDSGSILHRREFGWWWNAFLFGIATESSRNLHGHSSEELAECLCRNKLGDPSGSSFYWVKIQELLPFSPVFTVELHSISTISDPFG
jgi:hypothetical protein